MTVETRSETRVKKIKKTAWSGMAARVVSIATNLLMVPLTVHYLGHEQYGMWIAVTSLVVMFGFMDGGAGNAVINMVAHASGSNKRDLPRIVSTAVFSLIGISCIGIVVFLSLFQFIPWAKLFGVVNERVTQDLEWLVITVTVFFFISIATTLVAKIQRGLQEGNYDNFWSGLGLLLNLLFVYIAIQLKGNLIALVIASLSGSLLAYLASNLHYFAVYRKDLFPRFSHFDWVTAKAIFSVGGLFFVLQIAAGVQAQSDNILIANLLGSEAVTNYAICMKLFMVIPTLSGFLFTPLWPAYREAMASGDGLWVKRIFLKSLRLALLLSIPSSIALMLVGGKVIEYWVGPAFTPSISMLVGCGLWLIILTIITALAVFLNGLHMVKTQLIFVLCAATANVLCSIWLIQEMGAVGAVWGSVIANIIFILVPFFFIVKKVLNSLGVPPLDASAKAALTS